MAADIVSMPAPASVPVKPTVEATESFASGATVTRPAPESDASDWSAAIASVAPAATDAEAADGRTDGTVNCNGLVVSRPRCRRPTDFCPAPAWTRP